MIAVFDTNIVIDALNKDFHPDWDGIRLPYTL